MKDANIHNLWLEFISTYNQYVDINLNEVWISKLNLVKQYIDANKKAPSTTDKNVDVKQLGVWINNQKQNYNSDIKKCKQIMKDVEIHSFWKQFILSFIS